MKLLLIEDVDTLRKSLVEYLGEEGFEVEAAADGEQGLALALAKTFHTVILDLMLPGVDGYEVLKGIREAGQTVPVILITGRGALPDKLKGLESGADDYLIKPFEMEELVARVRALLRRTKVAEGAEWNAAIPPKEPFVDRGRYTYEK